MLVLVLFVALTVYASQAVLVHGKLLVLLMLLLLLFACSHSICESSSAVYGKLLVLVMLLLLLCSAVSLARGDKPGVYNSGVEESNSIQEINQGSLRCIFSYRFGAVRRG